MSLFFNEDPIFHRVKAKLMERGGLNGLKETVTVFRELDANKDNEIDPREWLQGLRRLGVKLTEKEAQYLFLAFDKNMDGLISIDEFVRNLIGQMNARRTRIVHRAYDNFSKTQEGRVECDQLTSTYNAGSSPLVTQTRRVTEENALREFCEIFSRDNNPKGTISREEFTAYYAAISAGVAFDEHFENLILHTWGIDDVQKPILHSTKREWGPNGDPLHITGPLLHRNNLNYSLADPYKCRSYDTTDMRRVPQPYVPNPSVLPSYISTQKATHRKFTGNEQVLADPLSTRHHYEFVGTGNVLVDSIRAKIMARSPPEEGFSGLRRAFCVMDKSRNHLISPEEAKAALRRYQVDLSPLEFGALWSYLDRNKDGAVTLTEFLRRIRGPMIRRSRIDVVRQAFEVLDTNGDGVVELAEIAKVYDTEQHPLVRSGQLTSEEALQHFVDVWDRNMGGRIEWEEWMEYYSDISAGIDDDQYFELLVRNAWHMSGGSGSAESTTCRRVLVTYDDGTQRIVEITNDIGIPKNDIEALKERLYLQGERHIVAVELV